MASRGCQLEAVKVSLCRATGEESGSGDATRMQWRHGWVNRGESARSGVGGGGKVARGEGRGGAGREEDYKSIFAKKRESTSIAIGDN